MAQQINDNFQLLAGLPIDDRIKKATLAERDGISLTRRFQGLQCFVEQTNTLYMLIGGTENSNWIGVLGSNASSDLETIIEGFYVLTAGKETLLDWEVGDKFRGWIGSRYVVGEILTLPVSLPSDIDNLSKVSLAVDSDNLDNTSIQFVDFERLLSDQQDFTIPSGKTAKWAVMNGAIYVPETENNTDEINTFTQSGTSVTTKETLVTGNYFGIFIQ